MGTSMTSRASSDRTTVVTVDGGGRERRQLRAAAGEPRAAARRWRPRTARRSKCTRCRCRGRSCATASGCRRATRISTSRNKVVLLPVFADAHDKWAVAVLQKAFPDAEGRADRLPRADLGPRRIPLPHPAAAAGGLKRAVFRRSLAERAALSVEESRGDQATRSARKFDAYPHRVRKPNRRCGMDALWRVE